MLEIIGGKWAHYAFENFYETLADDLAGIELAGFDVLDFFEDGIEAIAENLPGVVLRAMAKLRSRMARAMNVLPGKERLQASAVVVVGAGQCG